MGQAESAYLQLLRYTKTLDRDDMEALLEEPGLCLDNGVVAAFPAIEEDDDVDDPF